MPEQRNCDDAGEAVAAGAGGLVYVRVGEAGAVDAAKPVREGLAPEQQAALLAACGAEPARPILPRPHTMLEAEP